MNWRPTQSHAGFKEPGRVPPAQMHFCKKFLFPPPQANAHPTRIWDSERARGETCTRKGGGVGVLNQSQGSLVRNWTHVPAREVRTRRHREAKEPAPV